MIDFSRRSLLTGLLILVTAASFGAALAEEANPSGERVALKGYDPVSYFTEGHPEEGNEQFAAAFDDAVYWFKSAEHQAMFAAAPDMYAPQYGGFCAISMSRGKVAEPDPQAWTISDGKLYVFRSPVGVAMFQEQSAAIVGDAAKHWPELKNSSPASMTN
jgi:hypothetical protein